MVEYEVHRRDYKIVAITGGFYSYFKPTMMNFYGSTLQECILLVKNGVLYHCQQLGDRKNLVTSFLKRVNEGKVNYKKEERLFEEQVQAYENFAITKEEDYTKEMLLELIDFYQTIWKLAYAAADSMDVIETLDEEKKDAYAEWILKIRKRAEPIYKRGETEFLPKYLSWFAQHVAPSYNGEELSYVVFTEMEAFIKERKPLPTKKELQQRKQCLYIRLSTDGVDFCSGKEAEKIINEKGFFKEEDYTNVKEVKGMTAFSGNAEGKVCVVQTKNEMNKFKEGDVLVSVMTDPYYIPIMEKAAAVVTDDGGVLCHAAIASRELRTPCVVGTKIATKVFKDGDIVSVDATKGVVKRVE